MTPHRCLLAGASITAILLAGSALAQQAPQPSDPGSGAGVPDQGAPAPIPPWLSGLQVNGVIDAGVTLNPAAPKTGINFGQLFTDKTNQLVLNQVDLSLERPIDPAVDHLQFGFALEGLYGMDAQFTHFMGIGDQGSTGRNSFDLVRGDVELRAPLGPALAVDVKAGLFVTPMGYEKLDPTRNFFYSNSYIFNFGIPRKETGVLTTTAIGRDVDLYLGYDTGINASAGPGGGYNDGQPHVLAGVAAHLGPVGLSAFSHIGPEDSPVDLAPGVDAHRALRYDNDLALTWLIRPGLHAATELNYVRDEGLKADAGGVAQYLTVDLSPALAAGLRAEVWRDAQGAFVAGYPGNLDYLDAEEGLPNGAFKPGPATYGALTFGLNVKPALVHDQATGPIDSPFGQVILRPEIRYDRVLAGDSGFGTVPGAARDQVTFGLDVVVPLGFQRQGPAGAGATPAFPAAVQTSPNAAPAQRRATPAPPNGPPADPAAIATLAEGAQTGAPPRAGPMARVPAPRTGVTESAVTAAALIPVNPQTLQDLDGYMPDVAFGQALGGGVAPTIRGLGDAGPHTGQAPDVGLNLDGVAVDGAFAQLLDPGALSGVQATYGPAGLFQGRDAAAGVIDFTTQKPTRKWDIDSDYSLEQGFHASNERVRIDAPLGESGGLGLSLTHQQRGGYDDNVYTGDPLYGRAESTTGNLQLDADLTPALEVNLSVTLGHGDGEGNPLAPGDRLDAAQLGPSLTARVPALAFTTFGAPYLPGVTQPLGAYQTAADGVNGQSLTAQLYSLTLAYAGAIGRVTAITALLHEDQATAQDLDAGCAPALPGAPPCDVLANPLVGSLQSALSRHYRQFSQELRLDHDFGAFASLRLGAYVQDDRTAQSVATRNLPPAAVAPALPEDVAQTAAQSETTTALFANLDLHPTRRLTVSGGLRWVWDDETYDLAESPDAGGAPGLAGSQRVARLLSRVALDYRLTDAVTLYADRAVGFRPGGLALAATPGLADVNDAVFGPETDINYEAGARLSALDGRLTGRITGYVTEISGMQTPELVLTPGLAQAFDATLVNLPKVDKKGLELDLAYHPVLVPGLTVSGLGGYDDARITDGRVPAAQVPVTAAATAGAGGLVNLAGTPLIGAPAFTGTARADYGRDVGPGRINLDLAYVYTGPEALAVSGGQEDRRPAVGLLDFSMGYERSVYAIRVTARNILNQTYVTNAVPAFFAHAWGDPRTVVVSVEAKF